MIDHLSTYAINYPKTLAFYQAAFSALGHTLQMEMVATWNEQWPSQRMCAFGSEGSAGFWIIECQQAYTPRHIAFAAQSRPAVDAFYAQAIANGGTDNGAPGLRPIYHEHYYGGFVVDPDGNNIEAVCHHPD